MSSTAAHTSNVALLRSLFVENLDLLVVASEDHNICKCTPRTHLVKFEVLAERNVMLAPIGF